MTQIAILSDDPDEAVQWLIDEDIIRMPIQVGQVLLTVWNRVEPGRFSKTINYLDGDPWLEWTFASSHNYETMWNFGMDLVDEHYHRFGSRQHPPYKHGMWRIFERLQAIPFLSLDTPTPMPITPEESRLAYHPQGIFSLYTYREKPEWLPR